MDYQPGTYASLAVGIALLVAMSTVTLLTYRLYLSPLAKVPGPKLAAATGWYEFYYDCCLAGKYIFEIERMHNIYGPIVRISPHEVHIRDSDYFLQFNSNTSKLDKYAWFYNFVAAPLTGFGTISHDLHRSRRDTVARYFSTANVARLETLIQDCISKLMSRLDDHRLQGKVVDLSNAFRCVAADIITEYALPRSRSMLDAPDFAVGYNRAVRDFVHLGIWHRHIPVVIPIFKAVPRWVIANVDPGPSLAVYDNQKFFKNSAADIVSSQGRNRDKRATVLHEIYSSEPQSPEYYVSRLTQEAQTLIGAGTETTSNTLSMITFYLLADATQMERLKNELLSIGKDSNQLLAFQELQRLPYLSAVVSEGLRISSSASGRLARINPTVATEYKSYIMPAGTPISMSIPDVHLDESIFAEARRFKPERWLGDDKKKLERYLVPFGKGPRNCVGMNLAWAELFLVVGNLFRKFDMELVDTKEEDVVMAHDFFSPFIAADSKGLRVAVL